MRPHRLIAVLTTLTLVTAGAAPGIAAAVTVPVVPVASVAPADAVLVISSYATSPAEVTVGSRFSLSVTLTNMTSRKAEEVVVSLGEGATAAATGAEAAAGAAAAAGSDLVVLGTGNVKFIGTVAGKRSASVSFSLIASPKAAPGVYSVPVTISARNAGEVRSSTQTIGILIRRSPIFEFGETSVPRKATAGEPFEATAEIVNDSGYAVRGIVYTIEGDAFDITKGRTAAGTLETGDSESVAAQCTPRVSGDATLTVVISYRDDFNEVRTLRRDYPVKVGEPSSEGTSAPKPVEPTSESKSVFEQIGSFFMGLLGLGG
ncbi:MAG: hypothetical protein Q7W16_04205 [Coriobacteriia bacterium]|nr:hypothetical protein [Coriobacteriia bacterium]